MTGVRRDAVWCYTVSVTGHLDRDSVRERVRGDRRCRQGGRKGFEIRGGQSFGEEEMGRLKRAPYKSIRTFYRYDIGPL